MEFIHLNIEGAILFNPKVFEDNRGFFYESYNKKLINKVLGYEATFVFDCESFSKRGTIRGLHYQLPPYEQGKLIRVIAGSVFDVLLDLRPHSKSFGQTLAVDLSAYNQNILWIPPGIAHGFQALEDDTVMQYKITDYYNKESELTIKYNDPNLNIDWPLTDSIILSAKDKNGISFEDYKKEYKFTHEN